MIRIIDNHGMTGEFSVLLYTCMGGWLAIIVPAVLICKFVPGGLYCRPLCLCPATFSYSRHTTYTSLRTSFVEALSEKIAEIDETVPELPPKDLVFRIYRDIRFSNDPTPYKTHFSAAWSRTGRKGPYACYYVQIQPGGYSFVGSGLWHPEAAPLALLRRNINRKPHLIKSVLSENRLRKEILNVNTNDEKKAIKAFAASNAENALK
jgi:uncharacterized protein (TIGR02453 family)